MLELSLPAFDYKVKKRGECPLIFDDVRKRYVVLTPEEWVRQHLVHYLTEVKGCPPAAVAVEREIDLCGLRRRFDVAVFGRDGKPWLLAECKSPCVTLTRQAFDQAFRYNLVMDAPYVAVTNGIRHFCGKLDRARGFSFLDDFPRYP